MKLNHTIRRLHYWVSLAIAIPALILLASGVLLQTKKHWTWVQPPEQRGTGTTPQITLDALLQVLVAQPDLGVRGWDDIHRIDLRPGRGVAKVQLQGGLEVQVDLGTGQVLQQAHRRSDLIESIHDGSFFGGEWSKLGVFLPTGVLLLFLWGSGVFLFLVPWVGKRRRRGACPPP
ncbi:MAG: PepSY domain-containing protein [bacterium]|nr:PepSY domain-containing protein [bacterium]